MTQIMDPQLVHYPTEDDKLFFEEVVENFCRIANEGRPIYLFFPYKVEKEVEMIDLQIALLAFESGIAITLVLGLDALGFDGHKLLRNIRQLHILTKSFLKPRLGDSFVGVYFGDEDRNTYIEKVSTRSKSKG